MAESNWQAIKTAPKDISVLVYDRRLTPPVVVAQYSDSEWHTQPESWDSSVCHPTHWMPLPTPPQAEGGE